MRTTVARWWQMVDRTIHHDIRTDESLRAVFLLVVCCGGFYGLVMGSYAWMIGSHELGVGVQQMAYSCCKVPLLLFATFAISLPSFYVLNSLLGLHGDFRVAIRNILISQATLAIVLCSLSPLVILWYLSVTNSQLGYTSAILLNTSFFAVASFASQATLRRHYRSLIIRDKAHRWMLWIWLFVFALVGIQMGWVLRPFIGSPSQPPTFLRPSAWDNAYLKLINLVRGLF